MPEHGAAGDWRPLETALRVLQADMPRRVMGAPEDWPRWARLLPHVLAATGHLDDHAGEHDPQATDDAAWLLDRAATYLRVHARLTDARPLQERALAITRGARPASKKTADEERPA